MRYKCRNAAFLSVEFYTLSASLHPYTTTLPFMALASSNKYIYLYIYKDQHYTYISYYIDSISRSLPTPSYIRPPSTSHICIWWLFRFPLLWYSCTYTTRGRLGFRSLHYNFKRVGKCVYSPVASRCRHHPPHIFRHSDHVSFLAPYTHIHTRGLMLLYVWHSVYKLCMRFWERDVSYIHIYIPLFAFVPLRIPSNSHARRRRRWKPPECFMQTE